MLITLHRDTRGQVAIIFALCLIPLVAVAGFAIDFQQTVKRKQKAQLIMDSAVLAAARVKQTGATDAAVKASVQEFMDAQLNGLYGLTCDPALVVVATGSESIDADMMCRQDTALMRVIGRNDVEFRVKSGSDYGIDKIDVAFMFDISGSMNSASRLTNLKAAALEAIKILLPEDASPELIESTRLAMVSYNSMVNAGDFFQAVAGVPATRTYTHTIPATVSQSDLNVGNTFGEFQLGLYDAGSSEMISEIGDGAIIKVEDNQDDDLTVAITIDPSHDLYGDVNSMRLELSGTESRNQTENVEPYTLYGDTNINNMDGQAWDMGEFTLRIRAYSGGNLGGTELFDETIDFTLVQEGDLESTTTSYTLTSTCVWERDGSDKFTDAGPGPGKYLAHQQAWFVEDADEDDGGDWEVGHPNRPNDGKYDGDECRDAEPIELTNNRSTLNTYVTSLTADGWTAGHLGIAWTWYMVSENWKTVFDGPAEPMPYFEPDSAKVVILMTDGAFNSEIYPEQGDSAGQARELCDNMKGAGLTVYSVALNAPNAGKQVLSYCASGSTYYFEPETAAELTDAYRKIATSISDLRISR
ncbi:MAG: TadE/TadG family type IV pilus assembly protein [Pseudomonadota bacterium]